MSESQPGPPETSHSRAAAAWRIRFKSIFPFAITALVAVVLSLFGQMAFLAVQRPYSSPVGTTTMTSATLTAVALLTPTPEPSPAVTVTVTPTLPSPDERVLMQELIDIRAELRQAKSDTFLLLAASHLSDAEDALRVNNLAEVERLLVTVRVALDRAYEYAEVYKNPIDDFRVQVGQMREDLRVYPEGMDQQLRRLRQNILSIVSEDD